MSPSRLHVSWSFLTAERSAPYNVVFQLSVYIKQLISQSVGRHEDLCLPPNWSIDVYCHLMHFIFLKMLNAALCLFVSYSYMYMFLFQSRCQSSTTTHSLFTIKENQLL